MIRLKIFALLLILCTSPSSPLKPVKTPKKGPVYFPINAEDFKGYGIKLPSSGSRTRHTEDERESISELPSTTAKPRTTTMRLPIAQESHVAPAYGVSESPGASYLTESYYYIPGWPTTPSPRRVTDNQDISGYPSFEDDDRGNDGDYLPSSFYETNVNNRGSQNDYYLPSSSSGGDGRKDSTNDEQRYTVIGEDASQQDQERFGIFFIGEHESFGGSEEHFEEVPFSSLYISPNSHEEEENSESVLQSLPAARPSSLNYGSKVSVELSDSAVYVAPQLDNNYNAPETTTTTMPDYTPPEIASSDEQTYVIVPTPKTYIPPRISSTSPPIHVLQPTTESSYLPPVRVSSTPRRYSAPETTTLRPYTRARTQAPRSYTAPAATTTTTTERSYGVLKLVSVRRYTGPPLTTESPVTRRYSPVRPRIRYPTTTTSTTPAPVRYRRPQTTTEAPSHAIYFKPADIPAATSNKVKTSSSRQKTSYKSRERDQYPSRATAVESPSYSPARNLTVKGVSVATSSSVSYASPSSKPQANEYARRGSSSKARVSSSSKSRSRAGSSYKLPSLATSPSTSSSSSSAVAKKLSSSSSKASKSRSGSKYQSPVYVTSTKAYRAPSTLYQVRIGSKTVVTAPAQPNFVQAGNNIYIPEEYDSSAIPGVAWVDYPSFHEVPDTDFECKAQEHPGLYADIDAECQVFHICQDNGRHDSFLCPNGTVFNQQYFVCDWWYNFACASATRFFGLNEFIYELPEDDYKRQR